MLDRAAAAAAAGYRDLADDEVEALAGQAATDPEPVVRAAALGALARAAPAAAMTIAAWQAAASDPSPVVRRRAAEVAPRLGARAGEVLLVSLLADRDVWVADAAAFALGELGTASETVAALARAASEHADALVREAAVAALGSIGDPAGLPAILRACDDKPAVRRRAVLALAAFEGEEVEARLRAARQDRDWQVRQAAEDLTRE